MAYRQNGSGYHGSNSNSYGRHVPSRSLPHQHVARTSSFIAGDDQRGSNNVEGATQDHLLASGGYGNNTSRQNQELYMEPSNPLMQHQPTQSDVRTGYWHQGPSQLGSTAQSAYNPQQYASPISQTPPQPYSSTFSAQQGGAHQPYVPAAYQPASYSSYGVQPYGSTADTYGSSSSSSYQSSGPPPPLPARPQEQPYGNRRPAQSVSSQYQGFQHAGPYGLPPHPASTRSSTLPSRPSAYTPPAPPPPPFSPSQDTFASTVSTAVPPRPYIHSNVPSHFSPSPESTTSSSNHRRLPSLPSEQGTSGQNTPGNSARHSTSPRPLRGSSLSPSLQGLSPQNSPQPSINSNRHPHARPLPGPPTPAELEPDYFDYRNGTVDESNDGHTGYEEIFKEVEAAVMGRAPSSSARRLSPRLERTNHLRIEEEEEPQPLPSVRSNTSIAPDTTHTHTNGIGATGTGQYINYSAYSDDSDAEAAAGLEAMRRAEEEETADEARHSSVDSSVGVSLSQQNSEHRAPVEEASSDSDVNIDINTWGGGFPAQMHFRNEPLAPPNNHTFYDNRNGQTDINATESFLRSENSDDTLDMPDADYLLATQNALHPFPPTIGARVDTGGTGGLSEPSPHPRRLSFEDGDEATLVDSEAGQTSGTQSPVRDSIQDLSYYPSVSLNRPLPRVPGDSLTNNRIPQLMAADAYQNPARRAVDQHNRPYYPLAPDEYEQSYTPSGTPVHKANSLSSHSSTPQVVPPGRSITDAEQRRKLQQLAANRATSIYENNGPSSAGLPNSAVLDLPNIPAGRRKKFNPAKLSTADFKKCAEPWALSAILAWVKEMSEGEADLKEQAIVDGIVKLFTHKVPTMNTADAETLSDRLVKSMFLSGALLKDEEWVKFGTEPMTGVLFQLTGTGCYSPRVHTQTVQGRCYAHHCMRTLKKINLQTQVLEPQRKVEDWATFYKIKKEDIDSVNKKEVERQNNLHEIVTSEDFFMDQLNVLKVLYRDGLAKSQQPILQPNKLKTFLNDVFGKVDAIKQVNEDYLLAQLKYRQQEQGPWIVGFSDIFREWIRKAKTAYTEYAASFPNATFLVRREAERNVLFRQFLDQVRENERSKRLGWDTYLKAPITRLQRYGLLLSTVHKNMKQESEEKGNLQTAIEEIKVVTLDCDTRVAEMSKNVDLSDLANKLILRPGMEKVHLNLTHLGREIIFRGDLQRTGANKFTWLEIHAILFDHYLVLAKSNQQRDAAGGLKHEKYDVSKLPIPMDLLVLESANDDPVVKSSMKGIGAVTTVTTKAQTPQLIRAGSNPDGTVGPGTLHQTNTSSSIASVATLNSGKTLTPTTVIDSPRDERVMYPFQVKHLGKSDVYTLYAPTSSNRREWCDKIVEAKTRHAASLFAQNAEPFRLRVMADTAFAYDSASGFSGSIVIKGTPLDRAVREVENAYAGTGQRPGPVCRAAVNCATTFNQPYGKQMVAIGTDFGVFVTEYNNPRGWSKAITATRVTQIAVLEEFSLMLLIADKSLTAYHLDSVCPASGNANASSEISSRRAPQKLSGNRDVGFFSTGRMKDRTLVFYKKREGISSTFKVLEPVYQKSAASARNRFGIKKGTTEFFRDFDDFYIPSETYALNLFHSSLAVATARGFEVLTLDKKVPYSIPDLKAPECASIAARIRDQKPLGMFRLSEIEFLLVFEEVGIYVDKLGDVSRAVVLEFVGKARQATLYGGMFLILVDTAGGFVEVRNAVSGRLRQVISGRDVRLLDTATGGGTVKICMQHPEWDRCQIVVEMIVNEGLKE